MGWFSTIIYALIFLLVVYALYRLVKFGVSVEGKWKHKFSKLH
jgi:hypothetical protein